MKKIQEINWNNFKAKFNGKEQKSFERLCYHLFCNEFNVDIGIFRYKNQVGIETEPIKHNDEIIGFQAKFYETRISENKKDIIDSIGKAKRKNKDLTKILFYINKEFSESSKQDQKDPDYKIEIEKYAKLQDLDIEWRVPSHFEAQLALDKNINYPQHFFSLDKSVIDLIDELIKHTESILAPIHSEIKFEKEEIKLDRSEDINNLNKILNTSSLVILSGVAGVGKTALVKDFYDLIKEQAPLFVFKATEFNIPNINQLFNNYGQFTLSDFSKEYQDINPKYIIIDSAEKLSDIAHQEVFQEFLSALLDNKWKIIFATRHSYLDALKFQFIEVYRVQFNSLNINCLTSEELDELSKKYKFKLPDNERLCELLQIPFYLNEYLQNYQSLNANVNYSDFKNILWNKQISKTSYRKDNIHIKREECFLRITQKRADDGKLFIRAVDCDDSVLRYLETDEIIKYDSAAGGYFITHDIYEEWALEKIIERSFRHSKNYSEFFQDIGSSLPIRRAFRIWLLEKLLDNSDEVKSLIEIAVNDDAIEAYWKDDTYISVLQSDYAEIFFQLFKNKLLEDNQNFLIRNIFLLRIACKEIDEDFLNLFGLTKTAGGPLKTLFTRPKGSGWTCAIDFIHKHKNDFGLRNINIVLPLLDDWNNKNKAGETTKKASQIALYYYDEITRDGRYWYRSDGYKDQLIRIILQGASEITSELETIFDEIISKKLTGHGDKYYEIVKTILTSVTDSFEVINNLPKHVIKLADLFWYQPPRKKERYGSHSLGVEKYFGLSGGHDFYYFPASALQTPVFQLLRFAPVETINFILSFTNKAVERYAKSRIGDEVEEIEVYVNGNKPIRQYISNRLWNMYRGTQVSTYLLESIHMALESWLLKIEETTSKETLESWCLYLIKNSRSASITAIVASLALAQPSKFFNIAKILFQTKKFFFFDTSRMMLDQTTKSHYAFGYALNFQHKIFQDERIKTCEDSHRAHTLENLALNYQFFKSKEETEDDVLERQKIIWEIFDKYYQELPDKSQESNFDKTWRLYLARMDRRKMSPEVEEKNGQTIISLNPEIDPDLKKYSEEGLKKSSNAMKYSALRLWSNYRFEGDKEKYKQYQQYDNDPQMVISETKDIIEGLKNTKDENYGLFNRSIPAYACSVLIRDYSDKLNSGEKEFCRDVIINHASQPLQENYQFQISDGVNAAINVLPYLLKSFAQHREVIIKILLLTLFNSRPAGMHQRISDYSTAAILYNLWDINSADAHSLFLGYLLLKPKYNNLRKKLRKEYLRKNIYRVSETRLLNRFNELFEKEIEKVISNTVTFDEIVDLANYDLETLKTAFELLPLKIKNEDQKKFLNKVLPVFAKRVLDDDDEEDSRVDYSTKHRIVEKFAYLVLSSTISEIDIYIKPFVDNFKNSREMADFFQTFISVEDRLYHYEEFWTVWNSFYDKIVGICKTEESYYYNKEIVHNYLLAWPYWIEDAKEWHTLKDREKLFLKKVTEDIGYNPAVLYSLSKILNDIGSKFIDDGIIWISNILQKNKNLIFAELEINTIYYMENIMRRYILTNRQVIKTSLKIKNQVIATLNFLVERGSITGYLLREDIL